MTARMTGPCSWVLDQPAANNEAEKICARCEADYDDVFSRLAKAIGQMQARGDGDGLLLIQKMMVLAVNEIQNYFAAKPIQINGASPSGNGE